MPLLLSAFCIAAGMERWCRKRVQFFSMSTTATIIRIYLLFIQNRRITPVFHAFASNGKEANDRPRSVRFNTNSFRIGIDTIVSDCMSHNKDNFITYKTAEGQECKGIVAGMKIAWRITLKFIIYNDDGVTYMTTVRNSVHIPDLPMILVSLQHWAQQTSDGTESTSGGKNTILSFQWYRKTIPYYVKSNTPIFCSTYGTL